MALALLGAGSSIAPIVPLAPTGLTGGLGWWDTSVTASITLSGSNVTALADQIGSNHLANNSTVPYSATAFNTSYPGFTLPNSGSSYMFKVGLAMGTGNTLTAWYVGTTAQNADSTSGRTLSYAAPANQDYNNAGSWTVANSTSFNNTFLTRNNISAGISGLAGYAAGHRFIYTINSSGVITVYVDGVASTTATSSGNWVSGGNFCIGTHSNVGSDHWYGIVAEAGIATGFTSSTDVARLDLYLKNKWGL